MQEAPAQRVWDTALGQLQMQVTRPNFDTWLKDTVGLAAEHGSFIIRPPTDYSPPPTPSPSSPATSTTRSLSTADPASARPTSFRRSPTAPSREATAPSTLPASSSP